MSWQLDTAHSEIQFKVRHMMVSWVRGQFENFSGNVHLDEQNPANTRVDITIDAASITTRQADRDGHLRSPDFLDVENHPTLSFVSKRVEVTGKNSAKLYGDLTIRGVSKEVPLDVHYAGQSTSPFGPFVNAGFSAETTINRKDWGLGWNAVVESGGVLVGEEIVISIEMELTKSVAEGELAAVA